MPAFTFRSEEANSSQSSSSGLSLSSPNGPIYIAGIAVVGALVLGCILWFIIHTIRKRNRRKREDGRAGAFLSVKGLVKEGDSSSEETMTELPEFVAIF